MGKAGDWVRKVARDAVAAQLQMMATLTARTTPFITVGCLNADQKTITLADGSTWNVIISGTVCGPCGPVTRLNSTTYYMLGNQNLRIIQIDGGNKAYILAANNPAGSIHISSGISWETQWPLFTVFDIQNSSNYFDIPQDPSFDVFQPYQNQDFIPGANGIGIALPPPGDAQTDGVFYGAFRPGGGSLVLLRTNSYGKIQQNAVGNPVVPAKIDMTWTVLNGLGFNTTTNQVTWSSVNNGSTTLQYPGQIAGIADYGGPGPVINQRNIQHFEIEPYLYWDSSGNFNLDVIGDWDSQWTGLDTTLDVTTFIELSGYAYAQGVATGSQCTSIPNDSTGFDLINFWRKTYQGINERFRDIYDDSQGGTAAVLLDNGGNSFWCTPFGTEVQNINTLTEYIIDTLRPYDLSTFAPINSPPPHVSSDIKVTTPGNFTVISTLATGTTDTVTLTNYSWNTTLSSFASGTSIAGKPLAAGGNDGQVGTIMDWQIV